MNELKNNYKSFSQKSTFRFTVLGLILILMLVPLSMVNSLLTERTQRNNESVETIRKKWGSDQTLTGPVLSIPYNVRKQGLAGASTPINESTTKAYIHIFPENIVYNGEIIPQDRYYGIFNRVVYKTDILACGEFILPDLADYKLKMEDLMMNKALISFKVSDFRKLKDEINIKINDSEYKMNELNSTGLNNSIGANIDISKYADNGIRFSFNVQVNGSAGISFTPIGRNTKVSLQSTWDNPGFIGEFLPDNRTISDGGFKAEWEILHFNRNIEQVHTTNNDNPIVVNHQYDFGVQLLQKVSHYQKNERAIKYAFLFVILTFVAFFTTTLIQKKEIHSIQYILIGLAIVVFYMLLLALSEHIGFNPAYLISSAATVTLLSSFSGALFKSKIITFTIGGITLIFYSFMFILIQLQEYSLLAGSIGLFIIISILMYLSVKIKLAENTIFLSKE